MPGIATGKPEPNGSGIQRSEKNKFSTRPFGIEQSMLYRPFHKRVIFPLTSLLLTACLLNACTASRFVQPLPEGTLNLSAGVGGPFFDYGGTTIPMPLSAVTAGYGLRGDLTVFAGLHTTELAYGTGHMDLGAVKELMRPVHHRPGVSVTPALNFLLDRWERRFRFYPALDVNAYWPVLQSDLFYVGTSHWFEPATIRAHNETQTSHWIPTLHSGYTAHHGKMRYNVEMKYIAPWHSNEDVVVDYLSPTQTGALGLYFTVGRDL